MDIIFISENKHKFEEAKRLFKKEMEDCKNKGKNVDYNLIQMVGESINEIQSQNIVDLLKDKLTRAYLNYKRPVLVEHTILEIECLNNHPGTQTSGFWKDISREESVEDKGKLLCNIVNNIAKDKSERKAIARTYYGFCDGKNTIIKCGEIVGSIAEKPRGSSEFQWDMIFTPEGDIKNRTFAELEAEAKKDEYSMRALAMKALVKELVGKGKTDIYDIGFDDKTKKEIVEKIEQNELILFIGAGVSASIKMPSWNKLIEDLGEELGFDKNIFMKLGDNLDLAEYYSLEKDNYMDKIVKYFKDTKSVAEIEAAIKESEVYKIIANFGVDTIYTTNYEDVIERAFNIHNPSRKYDVIYDLNTLNNAKSENAQIIKFHGDLKKKEDMVLTQTSYYKRYDFENCLDIKLRNDLLTKSVLFIGYSFNDTNIKYMMYKLNSTWGNEPISNRPKSYIFLTENNPIQRKLMEKNNNIKTIVTSELDKTKALKEFLEEIDDLNKKVKK